MPIPFTCPHCEAYTEVGEQYAGQTGPCATCGKTVTIPSLSGNASAVQARKAENASTGIMLLIAVVGLIVLVGLLIGGAGLLRILPNLQANSSANRTAACANSLASIGRAMEKYYAEHGHYPPAYVADKNGKPMHSWRVLLLPYLDSTGLAEHYNMDEPWNSPSNLRLTREMPAVYGCPADPSGASVSDTSYVVVQGPGFIFDGEKKTKKDELKDGRNVTILVVEMANSSINWLEPIDLQADSMNWALNGDETSPNSAHGSGVHALL
ncbi:MAG: DUF1559 domain-containing protein, partial [Planctomycetales bacterium]|nr:DUF1559 domain-containing protein [Planctomycetales bacterium]